MAHEQPTSLPTHQTETDPETDESDVEYTAEMHTVLVSPENVIDLDAEMGEDAASHVAGEVVQYDGDGELITGEIGATGQELCFPAQKQPSGQLELFQPGARADWLQHEADDWHPGYSPDSELGLHTLGKKYQRRLGEVRCVLIDLSGTIHIGDYLIDGGLEGIELLRKYNIPYRFVTNTTKEPKRVLVDRLREFGFPVESEDIITSMTATREFLLSSDLRPYFILEDEALEDFEGISQEDLNCVCVGLSPSHFDYAHLEIAQQMIMHGAPLVGIHAGKYQKDFDGELSLGPGPFLKVLETACKVNAIIIGKPSRRIYESAVKSMNFELEDGVMIGDDVQDDVAGAMQHGMHGILVQTGKFNAGDERKTAFPPNMIAWNFRTAARAVVGAVCKERGISTDETDDEDEKGFLMRKSYPIPERNKAQKLEARTEAYGDLNRCPTATFCKNAYDVPSSDEAHAQDNTVTVKDFMEPEPVPDPDSDKVTVVGFPYPFLKKPSVPESTSVPSGQP